MELSSIQPSQLYISSKKLDSIMKSLEQGKSALVEPIPIKKLGNQVIFVDGHTRALAAFLLDLSAVPVYWEDEELDWEEYEICVEWCKKEGIHTISDLKHRIVSHRDYQVLWLNKCRKMQQDLEARRKTIARAIPVQQSRVRTKTKPTRSPKTTPKKRLN